MPNSSLIEHGPERPGGQGLDPNQYESGDRAIIALLKETRAADQVDLVATWRDGAYEVWSRGGMIRFQRLRDPQGALSFEVIEQIGDNPLARQDPFAVATIDEELEAARLSGNPADDPNLAYFEPHTLTHPYAYERIAQLFDSPRGPDLVVSPKAYAYGIQPGQHGALDVVQSRAPLVFERSGGKAGPLRARGAARRYCADDCQHLCAFPKSTDSGLKRRNGRAHAAQAPGRRAAQRSSTPVPRPERVYMMLLDGLSHSELVHQLENNRAAIPNLAAL